MVEKTILAEIQKIYSGDKKVDSSSNLRSLGITSLQAMDAIVQLETKLNCRIDDEDFENIKTVGDLIKSFTKKLGV